MYCIKIKQIITLIFVAFLIQILLSFVKFQAKPINFQ